MEFPPFLMKQLYRYDSVVITSFVGKGFTTSRVEAIELHITNPCTLYTGQQVAHLQGSLMTIMMLNFFMKRHREKCQLAGVVLRL
jgi:hypothetical protein